MKFPEDIKLRGWDEPITIVSKMAHLLEFPAENIKLYKPGTFHFNDGTTQGWTLDQLYICNTTTKVTIFVHPTTGQVFNFNLTNNKNLSLQIEGSPVVITTSNVNCIYFDLRSPDLGNNQDWQNANGYSADVYRDYYSPCFGLPDKYHVQLIAQFDEPETGETKLFAEWDDVAKVFKFHQVDAQKTYNFVWTASQFSDNSLKLRFLRIRFFQPYFSVKGSGECLPKGAWHVMNVAPQ